MQRLLVALSTILWTHVSVSAQSVIINEMSQGSDGGKEWVELLVIDEGVDLRGWELGDNDDGVWHSIAEFTTHSALGEIASGTIIVIYNSGDIDGTITTAGGEDTTFTDKSVILGVNNTSFLVDTGPWGGTSGSFANSDGDDVAAIRNASDEIIHDMAVTHPAATVSGPSSAKVKYYTGNTVVGIIDDSKWLVASSSIGTPGEANGGDNSNWVDQSLPVELSRWFATSTHAEVILNWVTDSEIQNQGFVIERCKGQTASDRKWKEITSFATTPALLGQGSTSTRNDYSYIDKQVIVGETYSYRLSDVDYRGRVSRHAVIDVAVKDAGQDSKLSDVSLHAVYPNPFNPKTTVSFTQVYKTLRATSLQVYNVNGRFVETLHDGITEPGTYTLTWNGGNLSSGIYFMRLSSGNNVQIQRVTLLR
jgi:hypothetical protein